MKNDSFLLETQRLFLREMVREDIGALRKILMDPTVMYAYEGAFDEAMTQEWFEKQIGRYRAHGFGLWAVVLKETGEMIGQCGLTMQDFSGKAVLEVGYLFQSAFWHRGYAVEAARACRDYAFDALGADKVYSIIRENNLPSQAVARRNGMHICGGLTKHYRGIDMPHLAFCVRRNALSEAAD